MLKRIVTALAYLGWVTRVFFQRWTSKGFTSALIFLRVRALNFWIHQCNKRSAYRPHLNRVECPCCGWRGFDFFANDSIRFWLASVFCPACGSHERHRMLHAYIHRHDPALPDMPGRLLHFAPEEDVRRIFAHNKRIKYFSTDYDMSAARARCLPGTGILADIQHLGVATDTLDIVFCLHVLEHVRKDREGIKEIHRVLKPGGIAYIMVPFDMALTRTIEWETPDPDLCYHIWAYATGDFKERLSVFDYTEVTPGSFLSAEEQTRFRIPPKEIIYRCVKQPPQARAKELSPPGTASMRLHV